MTTDNAAAETLFKCKVSLLDTDGQPVGFGKKLVLTADTLTLDKKTKLPLSQLVSVSQIGPNIGITFAHESGEVEVRAYRMRRMFNGATHAVKAKRAIDRQLSIVRLLTKCEQLVREGRDSELVVETCPFCEASLDLTSFENSEYVYCYYCNSIYSRDDPSMNAMLCDHSFCGDCGYYAHIRDYRTFNVVFLLVHLSLSRDTAKLCPTCARRRARNAILRNLVTSTAAIPMTLSYNFWTWLKALHDCRAVPDPMFAQLDEANRLAMNSRFAEALRVYSNIVPNAVGHPGVLTNMARVLMMTQQLAEAALALERAVRICPNYIENHHRLAAVDMQMERQEDPKAAVDLVRRLFEPHTDNELCRDAY